MPGLYWTRDARTSALPARSSRQAIASSAVLYPTVGLAWAAAPGSSESSCEVDQVPLRYRLPQMSVLVPRVSLQATHDEPSARSLSAGVPVGRAVASLRTALALQVLDPAVCL